MTQNPVVPAGLTVLRDLMQAYSRAGAEREVASVAVLGNAPLEPDDERADAIDSADLVIRVNSFVMDRPGAPRAQGRDVDVVLFSRMVPATEFLFADYHDRLYILLEPMRMFGRPEVWPENWPADLGFAVAPNASVARPLNEELKLPWRRQRLAPTTGTTALWLALNAFPGADIRFAGLSFVDQPDQTHWEHQWGDSIGVGPEHRIAAESAMVRGWLAEGRVRMLR